MKTAKKDLRRGVLRRLNGLSDAAIQDQSHAVKQHICRSDIYKHSTRISLYLSMPLGELRTDELARQIISDGKQLFVPITRTQGQPPRNTHSPTNAHKTMSMLNIPSIDHLETLNRNKWGIPEPDLAQAHTLHDALSPTSPGLDLILTPAVAFDGSFNRLGHGMGFYDGYIKAATRHADGFALHPPTILGLALVEQILHDITLPTDTHDEQMDAIVTSEGFKWSVK
ncbi:hypothetical protein E3P88_00593 [Wallemia ichthyophaga]|uniref:5-formyltetrahydrofolate cyclo-ligase n=2 Tax=Wallemia ichthyophaga TaxID=245174 RepID=A0A4T0HR99_WALIC|nr:5-formyltetrahydrofolate cyclo-ligase [Wallemia ichthyophaga EXF-994]EOR02067.1 5-formyltetrahydrofolate cyclo-ligase [Wallemia ichthyophaga EXF-994]TIB15724.1 hypothetical protein E3P90_00724 [Wallemia ichthyophaga]TIB17677.1 hypothetical protein E3P93_00581 [Wallemia ichthyophaga]TIB26955.1 hypothetical protein E3P88_00593 [Wallemia ichthyophaga]